MAREDDIERVLCTPILSLALPSVPSSTLVIRPYRPSDAASIAVAANSPAISRNMTNAFPNPYTLEDAKSWIGLQQNVEEAWKPTVPPYSSAAESEKTASRIPANYAIVLDDEPVGGVGLMFRGDIESRSAEIGYWLSPTCWKRGVMSAVATAFLDWAFDAFPYLVRVSAKIFSWNKGSMKVCEKAGMERESVMKRAVWKDGRLGDIVVYAKLRKADGDQYEGFEG
ncbi:hypothetical protein DV737_g1078, partial [Chaetothyriales sp. CBS 132003]